MRLLSKTAKARWEKSWFLSICPQYLWIDTPHAYGRTTLKFRFLMGIFKFSDPPYGGSNEVFGKNQNFPLFLNIKLHLKMPVNFNFLNILSFLGGSVPPLLSSWSFSTSKLSKRKEICESIFFVIMVSNCLLANSQITFM